MAKQNDLLAQRERKQKIFLAVGGVVFLVLAVIQGPKLWNQLNGSSAAPAAPAAAAPATTAVDPQAQTGATATPAVTADVKGAAVLVGVQVAPGATPAAEEGQLWSFSRFEAKDPFEPNVSTETPDAQPAQSSGGSSAPKSAAPAPTPSPAPAPVPQASAPAADGVSVPGSPGDVPAAEPAATNATIAVNGTPQQLELKDLFPKVDKTFVLVALKDGVAKIGVAGGSFTGGGTVSLKLGKQVTLVDTATGARYVLKLLYLGSGPEQIEKFSAGGQAK
jgi:hypothetical protein